MFTLRSTRRLLDRLRVFPVKTPEPPSTRLGDWYANHADLLSLEAGGYILCVSEKTLLPVVLPIMVETISEKRGDSIAEGAIVPAPRRGRAIAASCSKEPW